MDNTASPHIQLEEASPDNDIDRDVSPLVRRKEKKEVEHHTLHMTEQEVARNFVNGAFIFLIQIVLVFYALYQIFTIEEFIQAQSLNILVTRFLCAIILHINIEGEVRQSLNMLNHALFFTHGQTRKLPQVAIALMNFFGTLLCEVVNLLLLCTIGNP